MPKALTPTTTKNIIFYWKIPTTTDNTIQGDSVSFDVTYTLEQVDAD